MLYSLHILCSKVLYPNSYFKRYEPKGMKKVPLFEYEIPHYRKQPARWAETKPTK